MTALTMSIVYRDGLPYPDPDYLRYRIGCDVAESKRWRSRAACSEGGPTGQLGRAYLWHAYVADTRVNHRRRVLAEMGEPTSAPLAADVSRQTRDALYLRPDRTETGHHDSNQR